MLYTQGLPMKLDRFRSKLEARWATEFQYWAEDDWKYVDQRWHDFLVRGMPVEIKPNWPGAVEQAAARVPVGKSVIILDDAPDYAKAYGARRLPGSTGPEIRPDCPFRYVLRLHSTMMRQSETSPDPVEAARKSRGDWPRGWKLYDDWCDWLGWPQVV